MLLAVVADQPESIAVLTSEGADVRLPAYDDAGEAALALSALVRAAEVAHRPPAPENQGPDLTGARALVDAWMAAAPPGRELDAEEGEALLATIGIGADADADADADVEASDVAAAPVAARLVAWQDPVFGALVSLAAADGREASTLLAPADAGQALAAAERTVACGAPRLADVAVRLAALVDECPELASLGAAVSLGDAGAAARDVHARLAPSPHENPYLRRLRRAPVE